MKRHESLVPLSKEHHHTLILARLLRKDAPAYRGMPSGSKEKMEYALADYRSHILPHFRKEEQMFKIIKSINKEVNDLVNELEREHRELKSDFEKLNAGLPDTDLMDKIGIALDNHIRKEERNLFPLIQENCSEEMVDAIKLIL
ncbi:MAG: hemerythrin domain-containing protein [Bacteroidetes bacterium]|nr:hemerythrin domain-containing protein [Bacteroidota bacterium]MBS1609111.1 hemerythrin domain-containing protein [Bacteroidota bacterium]